MRQARIFIFLIILFVAFLSSATQGISVQTEKYFDKNIGRFVDVAAGEILVKFKPTISAQTINALNIGRKVKTLSTIKKLSLHRLKIPKEKTIEDLIQEYSKDPSVEYAEPNFIVHAFTTTPNDTFYNLQWAFPKIKADLAWDSNKGSSNIVIAIVDSGIDLDHPDLSSKIWTNTGEIPSNGIDDDGNGEIDDDRGWDFTDDDNIPQDAFGHGTHVAGIAGAATNNSVGVAGTSWNSPLMPVRVLDDTGQGLIDSVIFGIIYAADNGAKVINLSLGTYSPSVSLNNAVQYAHGKGCVIVAAAGNDDRIDPAYPAAYSNVIAVSATDPDDQRSIWSPALPPGSLNKASNYGSHIDVSAPGGGDIQADNIYSTYLDDTYRYSAGTSMATPFVSGLAALIFSENPSWTNTEVRDSLFSAVDDLGAAGKDDYFGHGRINANKVSNSPPATPTGLSAQSGQTQITLSWNANSESDLAGYKIHKSTSESGTYSSIASVEAAQTSYADVITEEGTYYYKISAFDTTTLESGLTNAVSADIDRTPPPAPTLDPVISPTNVTSPTLTGTKSADTSVILINGSSSGGSYPTSTSWSFTTTLTTGANNLSIKAKDAAGNESSEVTLSITLQDLTFFDPATGTSITFPIGSSTDTPTVSVSVYDNPENLGSYPTAKVLAGNALDIVCNVATFTVPITITMNLPAGAVNPAPYYWDTNTNAWSNSGLNLTSTSGTSISFTSTHLSIFAIFDVTGVLSDILIYPNPFKIGTSAGVIFNGLTGNERIRVYTIAGELVTAYQAQGETSWTWDVKNSSGNEVARGIYVYLITDDAGQKRIGKIAIIN